jgi:hypothetical protein
MLTAREAALRTVLMAEQHVIEQEARIDRQRDLILSMSEGGQYPVTTCDMDDRGGDQ